MEIVFKCYILIYRKVFHLFSASLFFELLQCLRTIAHICTNAHCTQSMQMISVCLSIVLSAHQINVHATQFPERPLVDILTSTDTQMMLFYKNKHTRFIRNSWIIKWTWIRKKQIKPIEANESNAMVYFSHFPFSIANAIYQSSINVIIKTF